VKARYHELDGASRFHSKQGLVDSSIFSFATAWPWTSPPSASSPPLPCLPPTPLLNTRTLPLWEAPLLGPRHSSLGRLGAPALMLLGDLADQAVRAGGPGLSRAVFISEALWELNVALCRGSASLCRSGAYVMTRAVNYCCLELDYRVISLRKLPLKIGGNFPCPNSQVTSYLHRKVGVERVRLPPDF
jgi:hypothetical protein